MDKLNNQRKVIVVASALGMLATFLPWANAPIVGSVSGTEGDGWITFLLFLAPLVLALRGDKLLQLGPRAKLAAIVAGVAAGAVGIWKMVDINSVKSELGDSAFGELFSASVSIGFGLYVVVFASLGVIAGAQFVKNKSTVINKSTAV